MYIGEDFPAFENQAARVLGFNLAGLLGDGEEIAAVTSRLRVLNPADDPTPADHLPVAPQFNGSVVNQLVSFNDPADMRLGVTYVLSFNVTTSLSRILTPWARFLIAQGYGVSTYNVSAPPAATTSLILPAPYLDYTLPTIRGGYVGVDLPTANQSEKLFYGFDFTPALSVGETISSATSFLALFSGTDNAVLNDAHAYDVGSMEIAGPIVRRMLAWPGGSNLSGNVYVLQLSVVTSANQSLAAKARINVAKVG